MEKWLRQFNVGNALLTLAGSVITEDERGRKAYHDVGLFWNPWDYEEGRTVGAKNHVSVQGNLGDKASIRVFVADLKDRKALEELEPTFSNPTRGIRVWEHEKALVVFITGERAAESWTVSHWRMFSGRTVFDTAKNKLRPEDFSELTNGGNGQPIDEMDDQTKDAIAVAQLDHGQGKNNGRKTRHTQT